MTDEQGTEPLTATSDTGIKIPPFIVIALTVATGSLTFGRRAESAIPRAERDPNEACRDFVVCPGFDSRPARANSGYFHQCDWNRDRCGSGDPRLPIVSNKLALRADQQVSDIVPIFGRRADQPILIIDQR